MLKIRVEGLPQEVNQFIENFQERYQVLHCSEPYQNRNSEYVRVYIEIKPEF